MSTTSSETRSSGQLSVRGPLFTAELNVYDHNYARVAGGVGELETELPEGIYEVETISGGVSDRKLVRVAPGKPQRVAWESSEVKFPSAAPLQGTSTTHEWQMGPAFNWSTQTSMPAWENADSRLFIFVRTYEPERYPEFDRDLHLYDAHGKAITDFSSGVHRDPRAGCMGLTVDLPAGFYQLYRGGRGLAARFQSLWLSPDFETQVFIPARERPDLAHLSLFMAPRGEGFNPGNEASLASETVLEGLQRGRNLATSEMMRVMFSGKFRNPWLGILALHALRLDPGEYGNLQSIVHHNVRDMLGDHPDLRVFDLKADEPTAQPFPYPPVLWASLRMIQEHASRHAGTVPADSLTARLFDVLVADSAWVAWRRLPQESRPSPPSEQPAVSTVSMGGVAWKVRTGALQADEDLDVLDYLFPRPGQPQEDPLLANLIRIIESLPFDDRQEPLYYPLDPEGIFGQVDPSEISRKLSLPISYVENTLGRMQSDPAMLVHKKGMTRTQQTVANYAVQEQVTSKAAEVGADPGWNVRRAQTGLDQLIYRLEKLPRLRKEERSWVAGWIDSLQAVREKLTECQKALLVANREGRAVYANPTYARLVGVPLDQVLAAEPGDQASGLAALAELPAGRHPVDMPGAGGEAPIEALHVEVIATPQQASIAHLYKLKGGPLQAMPPEALEALRQHLANMRLYVSLAGYGDTGRRSEYLKSLGESVQAVTELVNY